MSGLRLSKKEKLTHKRLWESLFQTGTRLKAFPLMLYYAKTPLPQPVQAQVGFSAPKRRFPKAVDRNRIKRLMREAYRLEKSGLFNSTKGPYAFVILYIGKEDPDLRDIQKAMKSLFKKFAEYEKNAED